jgi:uncharacterized protein (DUF1697 family)
MTTYVALLRGINVGGRAKVPMAPLRSACEDLGCTDVRTYLQSGNLVLGSTKRPAALRDALEKAVDREFGVPAKVVIRTHAQLATVVERQPYTADDPRHLAVGFLGATPDKAGLAAVADIDLPPDEFTVEGDHVYFSYPAGMGRSKLAAYPFEKRLGVAMTVRNWRTVTNLLELSG